MQVSTEHTESTYDTSVWMIGFTSEWKMRIMFVAVWNETGRTSAGFGKSSLKHSKSFRFLLSNQKLARALTSYSESNRANVAQQYRVKFEKSVVFLL